MFKLLFMAANRAMHQRKDPLSGNAILDCVSPDDKGKVGAKLVRLVRESASGAWSFASHVADTLPMDAGDGTPR